MSSDRVSVLVAWGHPSDPLFLYALGFAAGVCLLYAENLTTRLGGLLIASAAALGASGPSGDPDNWLISLSWIGIAVVVIAVRRPRWLRRSGEPPTVT